MSDSTTVQLSAVEVSQVQCDQRHFQPSELPNDLGLEVLK